MVLGAGFTGKHWQVLGQEMFFLMKYCVLCSCFGVQYQYVHTSVQSDFAAIINAITVVHLQSVQKYVLVIIYFHLCIS